MSYPKYSWACNRLSEQDMAMLYRLKQSTRKPITRLVAEAVKAYIANLENIGTQEVKNEQAR